MFDFDRVPLPDYTRKEDTINSVTHAIGVPLVLVYSFFYLQKLNYNPTTLQVVSITIYAVSMIVMFFGSAFYHGLRPSRLKKVARVMDHSNIFLTISGTLTLFNMFAVINYNKPLAIGLLAVVWVASIIGIVLTVVDQERFKKVQMAMYIGLGWTACIGAYPLLKYGDAATKHFFLMIFLGGVCFTIGAILYGVGKKVRYIHAVFHIFVVAGTLVQFFGIYQYI